MKLKRLLMTCLCLAFIGWISYVIYEENQVIQAQQAIKRQQQQKEYEAEQRQAELQAKKVQEERQAQRNQVVSLLSTDTEQALTSAINCMSSYADLVAMLGQPDNLRRSINGADLATWRFGDYRLFVSEKRKGETDVYAFKGNVRNIFAKRTFSRMLIQ